MLRTSRGSYEQNPSAARVCRNLKLICYQNFKSSALSGYECSNSVNLLEQTSLLQINETVNFEEDISVNISEADEEIQNDEENDLEDIFDISLEDKTSQNENLQDCVNAYVAGWLVKKIIAKIQCNDCIKYLKETENYDKKTAELINLRAYKNFSLTTPSDAFESDLKSAIAVFDRYFKYFKSKEKVHKRMLKILCNKIKLNCSCEIHSDFIMGCITNVLIKFNVKNFNNSLKNLPLKKKILKASKNGKLNRKQIANRKKTTIFCQKNARSTKKYL